MCKYIYIYVCIYIYIYIYHLFSPPFHMMFHLFHSLLGDPRLARSLQAVQNRIWLHAVVLHAVRVQLLHGPVPAKSIAICSCPL